MRLGIAHFSEPDEPQLSSVLLFNGKTWNEIESWADIPSDTIWISNVNKAALSAAKIANVPYLKSAQYLSTPYESVRREMMVSGSQSEEEKARQLRRLQEIYNYVITNAMNAFPQLNLEDNSTLVSGILSQVRLGQDSALSPSFLDVVNDCYTLSVTVPGRKVEASSRVVTLSYPKAPYAHHILSQSIPAGPWTNINRTDEKYSQLFELKGPQLDAELVRIASEKAGFLKVALVNRKDNDTLTVFRLSNPGGQWVTLLEAIELGRITPIKIIDAFLSEGLTTAYDALARYGIEKPDMEELISMSLGLSLTEIWKALTSEKIVASDNAVYYTPAATYLKAVDRIACMDAAAAVIERGFDVNAYGNNLVSASVPQEQISSLLELGYERGLIAIRGDGQEVVAEHKMTAAEIKEQEKELEPYRPPIQQ